MSPLWWLYPVVPSATSVVKENLHCLLQATMRLRLRRLISIRGSSFLPISRSAPRTPVEFSSTPVILSKFSRRLSAARGS